MGWFSIKEEEKEVVDDRILFEEIKSIEVSKYNSDGSELINIFKAYDFDGFLCKGEDWFLQEQYSANGGHKYILFLFLKELDYPTYTSIVGGYINLKINSNFYNFNRIIKPNVSASRGYTANGVDDMTADFNVIRFFKDIHYIRLSYQDPEYLKCKLEEEKKQKLENLFGNLTKKDIEEYLKNNEKHEE